MFNVKLKMFFENGCKRIPSSIVINNKVADLYDFGILENGVAELNSGKQPCRFLRFYGFTSFQRKHYEASDEARAASSLTEKETRIKYGLSPVQYLYIVKKLERKIKMKKACEDFWKNN